MTYEEEFEEWVWLTLGLPDDLKNTIRDTEGEGYRIQKIAYLAARQKGEEEREKLRMAAQYLADWLLSPSGFQAVRDIPDDVYIPFMKALEP